MADCLRFEEIKKTRKMHSCFGCRRKIALGSKAFVWVSVGEGLSSEHLCHSCGEIVKSQCFKCGACDDGEGFLEGFIADGLRDEIDCIPVNELAKTLAIEYTKEEL